MIPNGNFVILLRPPHPPSPRNGQLEKPYHVQTPSEISTPLMQAKSTDMPSRAARSKYTLRRGLIMMALIISGEAIFVLPFVVARIFRPTFLDVFQLTNFELGAAFSAYGVVAIFAYFGGGPLADRFQARTLMAIALVATGVGGIWMAFIPSLQTLTILYAIWGLTTIFLFWAAMIRATRVWGGADGQGQAYGILDGGRGLFSALLASISVAIFAALLPSDLSAATLDQRSQALGWIIWIYVCMIFVIALFVWLTIPDSHPGQAITVRPKLSLHGIREVMKLPSVWLQAIIVICAYVGYKSTDDFSLFARDAFGYDEVVSARIGTISFWIRPLAALGAGLVADRWTSSRTVLGCFAIMLIGSAYIGLGFLHGSIVWMLIIVIAATSVGIYGLRGIYFALFEEARVPLAVTGSAIGLVSVIGFTPDVFMGPLMGFLLDRSPGALGHQHVFLVVGAFALLGLIAAILFSSLTAKKSQT